MKFPPKIIYLKMKSFQKCYIIIRQIIIKQVITMMDALKNTDCKVKEILCSVTLSNDPHIFFREAHVSPL